MVVFFDNGIVRVHSGWFTSWRVTDLIAGTTLVPNPHVSQQVSKAWRILQGKPMRAASPTKYAAEGVLFDWFARAVIDPHSLAAAEFLTFSPNHLAFVSVEGANMQYANQS